MIAQAILGGLRRYFSLQKFYNQLFLVCFFEIGESQCQLDVISYSGMKFECKDCTHDIKPGGSYRARGFHTTGV